MKRFILISLLAIVLIGGCTQTTTPVSNQTYPTNRTEGEIDYGEEFRIEGVRNISLTDVQVTIRNIGTHGNNITLAKLTAFVNGEPKTITNIVGMKSNTIIGPGEWATFNVKGITSPCGKTLKLVLNTAIKFEDTKIISCSS